MKGDFSSQIKFEEVLNINYAIDARDQTVQMDNESVNILNRQIVIEKL